VSGGTFYFYLWCLENVRWVIIYKILAYG